MPAVRLSRLSEDLANGPNKPTVAIIGEYSASLQGAALILSLVRARNSGSDKQSLEPHLWQQHH